MLAYTLDRLLTQQAVIERDIAQQDKWGADSDPDWQPHLTVPCLLWWDRSSGARSAQREYVTPAREAAISQGGMLLPLETDVTELDRITAVQDSKGGLLVGGVFEIVAVLWQQTHMELNLTRPALGA